MSKGFKKFKGHADTDFDKADLDMRKDMHNFAKYATNAEKAFLYDANEAEKDVGPFFKIAAKDMEWAAGEVWKGVKWCYNEPPCKAAVEKYGMMAVKSGVTAAMAQQ